jgi:UDP-2-acetamido-3-amino-2,3-dideoxy-glucuronate N-acetyltransferase
MSAPLDQISVIECQDLSDSRGALFVLSLDRIVPFEIQRIFFIYDVPTSAIRGQHAHYRCRQFFVCQKGRILVTMTDGADTRNVELRAGQAILLEPLIFSEQTYLEQDAILLVLCSRPYEADDYIRDIDSLRAYLAGPNSGM